MSNAHMSVLTYITVQLAEHFSLKKVDMTSQDKSKNT